jgi:hypothetical protein
MSKVSYKRLGMALMGVAVPFMVAGSAAAAPGAGEVSAVQLACLAYYDISTCTHAVTDGVIDVVEDEVNWDLAELGVDYVVDAGEEAFVDEPGGLGYDINEIAVNPLPPLIPVPAVPGVPYQ